MDLRKNCAQNRKDLNSMSKVPFGFKDYNVISGIVFPPFITQQRMDEVKNLPLRADDVFVVGYCKSGTTWLQLIVKLILSNGKEDGKTVREAIPMLSALGNEPYPMVDVDAMTSPRAFKSHEPYDMIPGGPPSRSPAKYIYIARNPKDVIVSAYYHCCWAKHCGFIGTANDLLQAFIDGTMFYGSWFDHVLGWWKHRNDPNILFIKYEDMNRDLLGTVNSIADFIGCSLKREVIDSIVEKTTFDKMKDSTSSWMPVHFRHNNPNEAPFMRKGVVGDWKNHFTAEQWAEFDTQYTEKMRDTGLEFDFE